MPSLLVNIGFILQAILFDWRLGTLVWVYWLQGYVLVLLALLGNRKSIGWVFLLLVMTIYGMFIVTMTFPSDDMEYVVNGVQVAAKEVTVLAGAQWWIVFLNVSLLLLGYIGMAVFKKGTWHYSSLEVVKRIIPLHIIIIFAVFVSWPVLLFAVFRSIFDVASDYLVYRLKKGPLARSPRSKQ